MIKNGNLAAAIIKPDYVLTPEGLKKGWGVRKKDGLPVWVHGIPWAAEAMRRCRQSAFRDRCFFRALSMDTTICTASFPTASRQRQW